MLTESLWCGLKPETVYCANGRQRFGHAGWNEFQNVQSHPANLLFASDIFRNRKVLQRVGSLDYQDEKAFIPSSFQFSTFCRVHQQKSMNTHTCYLCVATLSSHREKHKVFLVVLSDTVVHPGTVVVHLFDAAFTHTGHTQNRDKVSEVA